jgi:hypothetical protein
VASSISGSMRRKREPASRKSLTGVVVACISGLARNYGRGSASENRAWQ